MNISDLLTHLGAIAIVAIPLFYYLTREKGQRKSVETELSFIRTELEESKSKSAMLEGELKESVEVAGALNAEKASLESSLKEKTTALVDRDSRISEYESSIAALNQDLVSRESEISRLDTTIKQERKGFEEKLSILDEAKKRLGDEFENLGNRIFEDTTKKFTDKNKSEMENLLNPLRDQIKDFEKKVTDTHEKASTDRASLKVHIENLKNLGEQMSREAFNLTTALKGESQTQGAWGEVVLERALEMSGLSEGKEYRSQPSYKGSDGNTLRPDVIVHLPEGKDIIIDSKVSLTAYERYVSCEEEEEKKDFIRQHLLSFRNHIKELGSKGYENIPEVRSLNYVLMFVPLESAFMLAIETEQDLYSEAFEKNVIIVCPSTLLATLRTIHSIWQFEYQNANARRIAESAGRMYDKFVTFVEHLGEVGKRIEQSDQAYQKAMNSLSDGKGNLVKRALDLKELGVKTSKELPSDISEKSAFSPYAVPQGVDTDEDLQ